MPKLAFKVTDRELLAYIPECMKAEKRQTQNRGPINDLWDRGFTMPTSEAESPFVRKYFVSWWSGQRLSFVLLVVSLLCCRTGMARPQTVAAHA